MSAIDIYAHITQAVSLYSLLVSVPLYITVLVLLWSRRKITPYDSTYYILFLALGIIDIICWLLYLTRKCVFWEFDFILQIFYPYDQDNRIAKIILFVIWATAFMQFQITLLIQLNRLCAVIVPRLYDILCTPQMTWISILTVVISSTCACIPILLTKCSVDTIQLVINENNSSVVITQHIGPAFVTGLANYYLIWQVLVYAIVISGLIIYPLIILKLFVLRSTQRLDINTNVEIKIFSSAFLLYILNFMYVGYFIFRGILVSAYPDSKMIADMTSCLLILLGDFYDTYNAYSFLITSNEIRRAVINIWKKILIRKTYSVNVVTSINLNNNNNRNNM